MHSAEITDGATAREFLFAGNARITMVSKKTGARFTFRVRQPSEDAPHFVSLLNGSDNESSYQFMGTIFERRTYAHGRKSHISSDAPSAKAFAWVIRYIVCGALPPDCEIWHEGRCGRCGRALTVPESISMGLGPECAGKVAA